MVKHNLTTVFHGIIISSLHLTVTDVAAEKTEKALIAGIEHFDQSKLKHTETQEKNPLPDKEGKHFNMYNEFP